MPIKVACACGAAFAAKDELAGRTVKCPKCGQPLSIPKAGAPAAPSVGQRAAPAKPAATAGGMHDLFNEAGLHQHAAGTRPCPGCAAPLATGAVICIKCGYNTKLGRRMETVKSTGGGSGGGGDGHGSVSEDLLNRAAERIAEDQAEDRKKTGEGLPWWGYAIGLGVVVGFMVLMMLIPKNQAMMLGGIVLIIAGVGVALYSYIRVVILAFQDNIGLGIMTVVLGGLGFWIYCFMRWDKTGSYFIMNLAGGALQTIGVGGIQLASYFKEEVIQTGMLVDPPAQVAVADDWQPRQLAKVLPPPREQANL